MRDHYDAVVVGSGYGGAVAAARLAMAGRRVCVLERGREFHPGQFPATLWAGAREFQVRAGARRWGSRTGLFELRTGDGIDVLVGCGLGGTSLINAGVAARPAPDVFDDDRWPSALRGRGGDVLAPYFARAERMLGVTAYPDGWPGLAKLDALAKAAAAAGGEMTRAPVAVSFRDGPNHVGVDQSACRLCGDCVTGCNHGAKNTVATNYLPLAVAHGAHVFCEAEARTVLPSPVGGWIVAFRAPGDGSGPSMFVRATTVVLAAGALGSTELLFRSRAAGLALSPRLGHAFSGNGNALAYAYDGDNPVRGFGLGRRDPDPRAPVGPTIAGMLHVGGGDAPAVLVEDGAVPAVLRPLIPAVLAAAGVAGGIPAAVRRVVRRLPAGLAGVFAGAGRPAQHTLMYLLVGDDPGDGRLTYGPEGLRMSSSWACDEVLSGAGAPVLRAASAALGAELVTARLSRPTSLDAPLTVHPLGGCPMGDDGATGVVDDRGRVFRGGAEAVHDGLFVLDGAIVPRPLATNPLLTITALAERAADALVGDARARPRPAAPDRAERPGLTFTDRMSGYAGPAAHAGAAEEGAAQGRADGTRIEFTVTVRLDDLPGLLEDPARPGTLAGTVTAPVLSPRRLRVVDGVFRLVQRDATRVGTWQMRYSMGLEADDGRRFRFEGTKILHGADAFGLALWSQTTTLRVAITDAGTGELVAAGLMTLTPADLARLVASMRVTGVPGRRDQAAWLARFHARFLRSLLTIYTAPLGEVGGLPATRRSVPLTGPAARPLRLPAPQARWCDGSGRWREGDELGRDAWLRLIRYRGGERGPVLLAAGFGMAATSFLLETIETNLVEHLVAGGYDVWLFDYRAGIDLPSARSSFTIDDIALRDWPTAVAEVRRVAGAGDVQAVGHCMGSATLMMALAAGLDGVRSAVCMQSTLHIASSALNHTKLALRVDRLLAAAGLRNVEPLRGPTLPNTVADLLLRAVPMPAGERCGRAICRWINAIYGCTHRHAQLDEATHDRIDDLFGVGDLAALAHIARMVRRGVAVDADGTDLYLAHPERLRLPILLLQGEHNAIFRPAGSLRTLRWLVAANGADHYERILLPGYAHLDALIGRNARHDVYPIISAHLDRHHVA
ncbi:cholesterol oxidase [Phytohabitans rumicis]|uniref:Cholesterol oxidase n=1 Tax=Phytohabitans rumicis TaxID=1076125 RepID=A0A6V8LKQ5_9ACTN|nr:cholesterol oxidase [Phytohabitans rumicis]